MYGLIVLTRWIESAVDTIPCRAVVSGVARLHLRHVAWTSTGIPAGEIACEMIHRTDPCAARVYARPPTAITVAVLVKEVEQRRRHDTSRPGRIHTTRMIIEFHHGPLGPNPTSMIAMSTYHDVTIMTTDTKPNDTDKDRRIRKCDHADLDQDGMLMKKQKQATKAGM